MNHPVSVVLTLRPKWKSDSVFCVYSFRENCHLFLSLLPVVVVYDAIMWSVQSDLKASWVHSHLYLELSTKTHFNTRSEQGLCVLLYLTVCVTCMYVPCITHVVGTVYTAGFFVILPLLWNHNNQFHHIISFYCQGSLASHLTSNLHLAER